MGKTYEYDPKKAAEDRKTELKDITEKLEKEENRMNPNNNEPWSGLEEVATYLGVNKDTIRNWIKKTDIPAHIIGRQ